MSIKSDVISGFFTGTAKTALFVIGIAALLFGQTAFGLLCIAVALIIK